MDSTRQAFRSSAILLEGFDQPITGDRRHSQTFPDGQIQFRSAISRPLESVEDRHHAVVVALRQRFELVIVAAGATESEAKKDLRGGAEDVVQLVVAIFRVGRLIVPGAEPVEARSRQRLGRLAGSSSPANCSRTKRSKGLSSFRERMT